MYFIQGEGVARYRNLRIWAERGLVRIEDARDNSFQTVSVRTMLERALAHTEMLGKTRASRKGAYDEHTRLELQNFIDAVIDVCKKAQAQGGPFTPGAAEEYQRRAPKTVVMPPSFAGF